MSNGVAPNATAQITAMTATTPAMTPAAAVGVALAPVRARALPGARSRLIAKSSRDAPTTHARQQPKALTAAPRVTMSPTQGPMYAVPRSPISAGDAMNALTPSSVGVKAIISIAVMTVK